MSFEEYLVSRELISEAELDKVDRFRKETGTSLYSALRKSSAVQPHALVRAISDFHGVPLVEDDQWLKHPASIGNHLARVPAREQSLPASARPTTASCSRWRIPPTRTR